MDSQIKGTEGEDFVNDLAFSSFFKYWCYPSPKYENGDKKEICDLLVIFNDVLIIFSVKNYEFKGNHLRYFNNTISKATKQIAGAFKTLFSDKEIKIKHPDKIEEIFLKDKIQKIFRIVVNLGENVKFYPFNSLTNKNDFVTVFDKITFKTIIKELDTIPDFIDYLQKREELFKDRFTIILPSDENDFSEETQKDFFSLTQDNLNTSMKTMLVSGSENDLLAYFLLNKREFPKVLQDEEITDYYLTIDGKWEEFTNQKLFENKKEADRISYFIDKFVENELLINITADREKIAKYLLSFDRLTRRSISQSYFDFHEKNTKNSGLYFGRRIGNFNGVGILFTSYTDEMSDEMFSTLNQLAIESFNLYEKYKYKTIILISTNKHHRFKFGLVENIVPYPKEYEQQIIHDINVLGWFTNLTEEKYTNKEFPD
ncbi:hypothetical protein [Chryseobacterium sp. EO14]|uniref:hypothetical protein n=1 Tax=Chryseobacterium sp. EO14 TaxID=2950551 RepID=UPI0021097B7C|nr:hypothetical protein [Chryseobacterium sp. EO14]MCQ4139182.1 hypothetical protein [Chryseobacterium sp. EO14]